MLTKTDEEYVIRNPGGVPTLRVISICNYTCNLTVCQKDQSDVHRQISSPQFFKK
jgi:hypothetical protein